MQLHDPDHRDFGSDNYAGLHPQVLAAIAEANGGHQRGYGDDVYTERFAQVLRAHFGPAAVGLPVFNGTGANVVALAAMTPRWGSVVVPSSAHVHTDEAGAPERMAGLKLLTVATENGKLTPALVGEVIAGGHDVHFPQPSVVALAQATELGTVYTMVAGLLNVLAIYDAFAGPAEGDPATKEGGEAGTGPPEAPS